MAATLSRREGNMYRFVQNLDDIIKHNAQECTSKSDFMTLSSYKDEIKKLLDDVKEIQRKQNMDWIQDIINEIQTELHSI